MAEVAMKGIQNFSSRPCAGREEEYTKEVSPAKVYTRERMAAGEVAGEEEWVGLKTSPGSKVYLVGDVTGTHGILEATARGNQVGRMK